MRIKINLKGMWNLCVGNKKNSTNEIKGAINIDWQRLEVNNEAVAVAAAAHERLTFHLNKNFHKY